MYRSDFDEVNPWDKSYTDSNLKYTGKGREDDDLLEAVVKKPGMYRAFRAVDPYLRHSWHMKICRWNMRRRYDCIADAYKALGVSSIVGRRYLKTKDLDLQHTFLEFDEDWDENENAISLKRSKRFMMEDPNDPQHGSRWM